MDYTWKFIECSCLCATKNIYWTYGEVESLTISLIVQILWVRPHRPNCKLAIRGCSQTKLSKLDTRGRSQANLSILATRGHYLVTSSSRNHHFSTYL